MGRVIPYIDIETNRLPEARTFALAVDVFNDVSREAIAEGTVEGTFIFGSVAVGEENERSDFDAFIMLPEAHIDSFHAAQKIARIVADETFWLIPVSTIVQTRDALAQGRHEMDKYFCEHLTGPYRILNGEDPAHFIRANPASAHDILSEYIAHKKRRIANDYNATSPDEIREGKSLQRMMELPLAIGRKTIQALNEIGVFQTSLINSADKGLVSTTADRIFKHVGLGEGFDDITAMRTAYDNVFVEAARGAMDQKTYEGILIDLHAQLPHALIWLDQVETELLPKLKK